MLFLPGFIYATRGTSIRLADVLSAMLPSFALMIVSLGAVYLARTFIAQDWHAIARLVLTAVVVLAVMTCGAAVVYGRSFLSHRTPTSDLK
jgi:hypothetical protein